MYFYVNFHIKFIFINCFKKYSLTGLRLLKVAVSSVPDVVVEFEGVPGPYILKSLTTRAHQDAVLISTVNTTNSTD